VLANDLGESDSRCRDHARELGRITMRSFIVACVAAVVIAVIGAAVLNMYQKPVAVAFTTTSVRL